VFIGEEITAEVVLLEIDTRRRIGRFQTNCYNADKELVLEGLLDSQKNKIDIFIEHNEIVYR
jgi:acyl dehydratase